jgi:pyruvate dehydrogenase E1 component alpha subunit
MHVTDWGKRVMPSGIVGTSVTLATGAALAIHLRGDTDIAMASFGDGATNSGSFHEGMNMAAVWHLPTVFVCENNGLAVSTHLKDSTSVTVIADRAAAYGIPGVTVDGIDPIASYSVLSEAVDRARAGKGPTLIVANVCRWKGHAAWDRGSYLTKAELEEMIAKDPLPKYRDQLVHEGILSNEEIKQIDSEMRMVMDEAVRFAEDSPAPSITKEEALKYVFA